MCTPTHTIHAHTNTPHPKSRWVRNFSFNFQHRGQGHLVWACIVENAAGATSTPEPPKFQEAQSPWPRARETSCPECLRPPVSLGGVMGVQARGDEEGNLWLWLWLWLCSGLSFGPHLQASLGKLLPRKRGLLKPHRPPGGVCAAGVMRGRVPTCSSGHGLSAEQSLSSVQSCWAPLLVPGAGCGCSSGRVQARATVPGDHLQGWAAPGGQGGTGPETRLELLAEQRPLVASRGWCCLTLDPAEALCPSPGGLGSWI